MQNQFFGAIISPPTAEIQKSWRKLDFPRISRFREAGDILPLLRACLKTVKCISPPAAEIQKSWRKLDFPKISRFREAGDFLGGKNEVHPKMLANTTLKPKSVIKATFTIFSTFQVCSCHISISSGILTTSLSRRSPLRLRQR